MESSGGNKELSLKEELYNYSKQFSFEMAVYIFEYSSKISFGKETDLSIAPFQTKTINSFHLRGTEIEKILIVNEIPVIYVERLAISGLNGPLPTPYAELIFKRSLEKDTSSSLFINIFNTRLLGISYQISKRRWLNLQSHKSNCLLLRTIASFFGENPLTMDRKMSRLSYLFWTKERSVTGLKTIISSFFHFIVEIREFKTFTIKRNNIQKLGNMRLGCDSELGKLFFVSSFGIEINLIHDDYRKIFHLITDRKYMNEVKSLIRRYLGDFFFYTLKLTPKNVPPLKISETLLGRTSMIPGHWQEPFQEHSC
ncbi:MAG: type VI secretion system baseplate subunit TssG [Holosporaceae bacterium]|jgi:predicted component of type VI protein secretion system|nr:type VI secretion system baseplate subunit TssG [Holosporaceae bacterium]